MYAGKKVLVRFGVAAPILILFLFFQDKEIQKQEAFLKGINLQLDGIVGQVIPTNEHSYGAVYLKSSKSNKPEGYQAVYKNIYVYCNIGLQDAILVTSGSHEIQVNDSLHLDSKAGKLFWFRNGKVISSGGLSLSADESLYRYLRVNGYLDLGKFRKAALNQ